MSGKSSTHSNLHSNCRHGPRDKKIDTQRTLTTKPFCDCKDCACNNCPDILGMLSITITEKSCDFGSKDKKCCKVKLCADTSLPDISPRPSSIMGVMKDRDCSCDIMARAVRSNIHMNMGLNDRRESINLNQSKTPTPGVNQATKPSPSNQPKPTE